VANDRPVADDAEERRRARLVQNEIHVRRLNRRIEELNRLSDLVDLDEGGEQSGFLCECSRLECVERLPIDVDEYARAHDRAERFTVAPGHDEPGIERVVGRGVDYVLVEKITSLTT
jgi:hypothetical protein